MIFTTNLLPTRKPLKRFHYWTVASTQDGLKQLVSINDLRK